MRPRELLLLCTAQLCFIGFTLCATDLLPSRKFCGYQHSDDYNRDNDNISIDEFPWIAQIQYGKDRSVRCTGSLINNRYVLTGAQCLIFDSPVTVRLGDFNVTSDQDCVEHIYFGKECSDPAQEFEIVEVIPHLRFNRDTYENDIGLIRLSRNVEYSDYIRPICLPSSNGLEIRDGDELALSGWGYLGADQKQTEVKKKILAAFVDLEECNKFYEKFDKVLNSNFMCAIERSSYSCHGDGGGPLMRSVKNQWEVVGILLFGVRCDATTPSGYLKIKNYIEWIEKHLRK